MPSKRNSEVEITLDGDPITLYAWRQRMKAERRNDLHNNYVSSAELIDLLRVDHATLKRWRTQNKIQHKNIGGRWFYATADVPSLASER